MSSQIVTTPELMAERPEMVESITDLIIASSISTLVETDDNYFHLRYIFIRYGEDIVENYKSAKQGIDLSEFESDLHKLATIVICNIGSDLFTDMLDTDDNAAHSEVLRCFGEGVSFWDDHNYKDFGFKDIPKLKTTLEYPYYIASHILDKISETREQIEVLEDWI